MWKPGQSGNPAGPVKEKRFLAALERAMLADSGELLRKAADALLKAAADGQAWAIQQLADRLDGKPTQQVDMIVTRQAPELSDDDLNSIAAGGSARAAVQASSPEKPNQLH